MPCFRRNGTRLFAVGHQFVLEGLEFEHTGIIYSNISSANSFSTTRDGYAVRALDPAPKGRGLPRNLLFADSVPACSTSADAGIGKQGPVAETGFLFRPRPRRLLQYAAMMVHQTSANSR